MTALNQKCIHTSCERSTCHTKHNYTYCTYLAAFNSRSNLREGRLHLVSGCVRFLRVRTLCGMCTYRTADDDGGVGVSGGTAAQWTFSEPPHHIMLHWTSILRAFINSAVPVLCSPMHRTSSIKSARQQFILASYSHFASTIYCSRCLFQCFLFRVGIIHMTSWVTEWVTLMMTYRAIQAKAVLWLIRETPNCIYGILSRTENYFSPGGLWSIATDLSLPRLCIQNGTSNRIYSGCNHVNVLWSGGQRTWEENFEWQGFVKAMFRFYSSCCWIRWRDDLSEELTAADEKNVDEDEWPCLPWWHGDDEFVAKGFSASAKLLPFVQFAH